MLIGGDFEGTLSELEARLRGDTIFGRQIDKLLHFNNALQTYLRRLRKARPDRISRRKSDGRALWVTGASPVEFPGGGHKNPPRGLLTIVQWMFWKSYLTGKILTFPNAASAYLKNSRNVTHAELQLENQTAELFGALSKPRRLQPESVGQVGLILTSRLLQGLFINFLFQRSRK